MDILYLIILGILVIVLVILLIVLKPKKIEPITKTIDDDKIEKTEIEKVIEALETKEETRPMTTFEEEQEANAIISYQELVKAVNEKKGLLNKEPNTVIAVKEEEIVKEEVEQPKFKSSEFISPIFGKEKSNDEFLKELKDFRSNL